MKAPWLLLAAAGLLASCKEKTPASADAPAAVPSETLTRVLTTAPAGDPQAIHTARTSVRPGEEVTISGRIMGSSKPFVDGRAAFILGDPGILTPCNEHPGDDCATPWDTCCDAPEDKKRATATIRILDAEGRVLKEAVEGIGGLEKLAQVIVTGKVAEGSSADLLLIDAQAIRAGK